MNTSSGNEPSKYVRIPVRPWLFVCFILVIVVAAASYIDRYVTEEYLPPISSVAPPTPTPTQTPSFPPISLSTIPPQALPTAPMMVTTRWSTLVPPLFGTPGSPFRVTNFGPGTKVIAYLPEFTISDAAIAGDGTLYVAYMWALLDFVSGGGPFPYKLGVLTAGVLRPIPSPVVSGPGYVTSLGPDNNWVVFNTGAQPYLLDDTGFYQLITPLKFAPDDDTNRPQAVMLANGKQCAPPSDKTRSALDAIDRHGGRHVLLTPRQLYALTAAHETKVSCYHFGGHNIFAVGDHYNASIYVALGDALRFLVDGQVLAANNHRLLVATDAGGNHQWLLEGFAL